MIIYQIKSKQLLIDMNSMWAKLYFPTDSTDFHEESDTTKRNSVIFTDKNKTFGLIKICEDQNTTITQT